MVMSKYQVGDLVVLTEERVARNPEWKGYGVGKIVKVVWDGVRIDFNDVQRKNVFFFESSLQKVSYPTQLTFDFI
jgi:hypothetical protein